MTSRKDVLYLAAELSDAFGLVSRHMSRYADSDRAVVRAFSKLSEERWDAEQSEVRCRAQMETERAEEYQRRIVAIDYVRAWLNEQMAAADER